MNYELKTFQFALNMLKLNLEGSLNFERALLKLQRAIKSKERKKSFGGFLSEGGGRGR
jgi:hypothetical protein